jgi:hypothetical protein
MIEGHRIAGLGVLRLAFRHKLIQLALVLGLSKGDHAAILPPGGE